MNSRKEKVVSINKFKDVNMWKIEGESFREIKALSDAMDSHLDSLKKYIKDQEKAFEAHHKKLWKRIEKEVGKTDISLCLDCEYKDLGFFIVKKSTKRNDLGELLKGLFDK